MTHWRHLRAPLHQISAEDSEFVEVIICTTFDRFSWLSFDLVGTDPLEHTIPTHPSRMSASTLLSFVSSTMSHPSSQWSLSSSSSSSSSLSHSPTATLTKGAEVKKDQATSTDALLQDQQPFDQVRKRCYTWRLITSFQRYKRFTYPSLLTRNFSTRQWIDITSDRRHRIHNHTLRDACKITLTGIRMYISTKNLHVNAYEKGDVLLNMWHRSVLFVFCSVMLVMSKQKSIPKKNI